MGPVPSLVVDVTHDKQPRKPRIWPRWGSHAEPGPPPVRRRFWQEWDRLLYLYVRADYWLRRKNSPARARRFVRELTDALQSSPFSSNDDALVIHAARAVIADAAHDASAELAATQRLVELIPALLREWPECPDTSPLDLRAELLTMHALGVWQGDRGAQRTAMHA